MTATREQLLQQIEDLKRGTAFHVHTPRDGTSSFRCSSPYCDDLGAADPMGPPPAYAPAERYRRIDA